MKHPERTTKTHIYFWGSYYSQWAKYDFIDESLKIKFTSCEQYMMWNKAMLFKDKDSAKKIIETNNVKKQKELGRKVKGFDQKEWDKQKFNIIVKGNFLKFSQNKDIQKELLESGVKVLVEASPYDKIYGVGLKWDNDLILDENNWQGENLLGKALMEVREMLRTQNGNKLKDFFNQPTISKEEYNQEVLKELNDDSKFNQNIKNIINHKVGSLHDRVTNENFGEKLLESANEALSHAKGEKELKTTEVKLYDKLVRDKIPEVIQSSKKKCDTHNETDKNKLLKYYVKKIQEELKEVIESKNKEELVEELADLTEVLDGLLDTLDLRELVTTNKENKRKERGGFSNLILKSVKTEYHEWFFYKQDQYQSCKKCGTIKNDTNSDRPCPGKVKVTLRGGGGEQAELFKEVQGSILEAKEDIIAQGCNCEGASGAGIAKYIAQEYPESDKKYKELCENKQFHLGSVLFNKEKEKTQAFCGTQQYYGKYLKMDKDSVEKRYEAIEECLKKIYAKAKNENLSVALPRIGCGRARADWDRVKGIIKKIFHDHPVTIYWIPDKYSK